MRRILAVLRELYLAPGRVLFVRFFYYAQRNVSLRGAEQGIHCKSDETMFLPRAKAMRRWRSVRRGQVMDKHRNFGVSQNITLATAKISL